MSTPGKLPSRPIRTPLLQRLADLRRGPLTFLVWAAAAGGAYLLLEQRTPESEYIGLTESVVCEVATQTPGVLESLEVDLLADVSQGMLLGRLESTTLEARIKTASARVSRLEAELQLTEQRLMNAASVAGIDWTADLRRFQVDETRLSLEILQTQIDLETSRVEVERLALELQRVNTLVDEAVLSQADLDDARLAHERVLRRIQTSERLLASQRQELATARTRREGFAELPPPEAELGVELEVLRRAITVQQLEIEELALGGMDLVLRAPIAGRISAVLAHPGQSLATGQPVVQITSPEASIVLLYLPEAESDRVGSGRRVLVARRDRPNVTSESLVTRVYPGVAQLPTRLWRDPAVPEYGRAALLSPPHALALVPGEVLSIQMLDH